MNRLNVNRVSGFFRSARNRKQGQHCRPNKNVFHKTKDLRLIIHSKIKFMPIISFCEILSIKSPAGGLNRKSRKSSAGTELSPEIRTGKKSSGGFRNIH